MEFNFAKKQVSRISRNKIILMLIIAVVISALILLCAPSVTNLYSGGASFETGKEAEKLLDKGNNYVSVTAELLLDTGCTYTEDKKIKGKYYAFWIEDKCIICKVDKKLSEDEYENYKLSGKLKKATGVDAQAISAIKKDAAEYMDGSLIANYILDTQDSQLGTQIIVGIGILLALTAIISIIPAIISLTDYKKNKFFKKMGVNAEDAERINQTISNLYNRGIMPKEIKSIHIIGDYLMNCTFMAFKIYKKEDIVWIYKSITRHRTNGIPTGKTYAILLKGKNKENISIGAKSEKQADQMMEELYVEIPYAIMGYSDELMGLYGRDRAGFLAFQESVKQEREAEAGVEANQ